MAHQFSALHRDGFVAVSHKTRERLREVNMIALGLITEMSAHIDGFPVTLDAIIKRAKKPGAKVLREAYQDLIDERLVVYVQYTLQLPGKRPYPSGTTVIAHEAITDEEFASKVVESFTPGSFVLDRQSDDEVRRVKVLSATVRYWGGEKKITEDGSLIAAAQKAKPGPKRGSGPSKQPTKAGVELDASSSTMTCENAEAADSGVELDASSSTMTCENGGFSQRNVELDVVESTTSSSLTRRLNKNTNQTKAAGESDGTRERTGWLAGSTGNDDDATAGAALLRSLGVSGQAITDWTPTVDAALSQLGEQQTRRTLESRLAEMSNPAGAIITTRLPQLHGRLSSASTSSTSQSRADVPDLCGQCTDRWVMREDERLAPCPECHPSQSAA